MSDKPAFSTPSNTGFPTITIAIDVFRRAFEPFVWKTDSPTEHGYRLHAIQQLLDKMWHGQVQVRWLLERGHIPQEACAHFKPLWRDSMEMTFEDAEMLGFSRETFTMPALSCRAIPQLLRKTPALATLSNALDSNFILGDNPVRFLMRHLGARLCLKAYSDLLFMTSSKTERALQKVVPEVEWQEAPELAVASVLFTLSSGSTHPTFGYMTLQEVLFMKDLFELFVRQTND